MLTTITPNVFHVRPESPMVALYSPADGRRISNLYEAIYLKGLYRITRINSHYGILKCLRNTTHEIVITEISSKEDAEKMIYQLQMYGYAVIRKSKTESILIDSDGRVLIKAPEIIPADETKNIALGNFENEIFVIGNGVGEYSLFNAMSGKLSKMSYTMFENREKFIKTYKNKLCGIILPDFTEILEPQYTSVFVFCDGFKGITLDGKEVVIQKNWDKPSFPVDKVFPKQNGFFRLCNTYNGRTRYSYLEETTGKQIVKFLFIAAEDFQADGTAKVSFLQKAFGTSKIDKNGNLIH